MEKEIIEIKGIKMEVDLREARKIEAYKVGQNVRVLKKEYGDSYKVYPGVIVGFDAFEKLPTIAVAYLDIGYSEVKVEFAYINNNSKDEDYEIAPCHDIEELRFKKTDVLTKIQKEVTTKEEEIKDLQMKRDYFLKYFDQYFSKESLTDSVNN